MFRRLPTRAPRATCVTQHSVVLRMRNHIFLFQPFTLSFDFFLSVFAPEFRKFISTNSQTLNWQRKNFSTFRSFDRASSSKRWLRVWKMKIALRNCGCNVKRVAANWNLLKYEHAIKAHCIVWLLLTLDSRAFWLQFPHKFSIWRSMFRVCVCPSNGAWYSQLIFHRCFDAAMICSERGNYINPNGALSDSATRTSTNENSAVFSSVHCFHFGRHTKAATFVIISLVFLFRPQ